MNTRLSTLQSGHRTGGARARKARIALHAAIVALAFTATSSVASEHEGMLTAGVVSTIPQGSIHDTVQDDRYADTYMALGVHVELDDRHLDTVRGRYVPSNEQEVDDRWGVILWDESQGGKTGSSTGQQRSTGSGNIQNNSVKTN